MLLLSSFEQGLSLRAIRLITRSYSNLQRQLGFGIHYEMDFVAKEGIVLALGSPLCISIRVTSGTITFTLTGAGLMAEFTCISPDVCGIYSGITTLDYLQDYSLGNQLVQDFIENLLTEAVAEVSEGAIGRGLEKIEAAEKT